MNGTNPDRVGWVQSPNQRGTIDIIWTCLLTILACSWTVLHLNVPSRRDSVYIRLWRKVSGMVAAIFAPEWNTALAYKQWRSARKSVPKMRELGMQTWKMAHGFYADMGGFIIEFDDMAYHTLDFEQLYWCIERGHVNIGDINISAEDILDRSKADIFTKAVASSQALWLVLQSIARAAQHLTLSLLELATCAYIVCAVVTYWFWRLKPLDTNHQTTIKRGLAKDVLTQIKDEYPDLATKLKSGNGAERVQNRRIIDDYNPLVLWSFGLLFSAIHLLAWNDMFPTVAEQYHWRIFAACGTGATALLCLTDSLDKLGQVWLEPLVSTDKSTLLGKFYKVMAGFGYSIVFLSVILYFIARAYLLFAIFYGLRSMPSDAYDMVDWTTYIPSFR
ncbi:hypothetical protein AA313_de0205665 [Arthrobotrys entomopaga]|nr:hypothetical protein AA313_de0205665 [Arthrobotrys entomopaga]